MCASEKSRDAESERVEVSSRWAQKSKTSARKSACKPHILGDSVADITSFRGSLVGHHYTNSIRWVSSRCQKSAGERSLSVHAIDFS